MPPRYAGVSVILALGYLLFSPAITSPVYVCERLLRVAGTSAPAVMLSPNQAMFTLLPTLSLAIVFESADRLIGCTGATGTIGLMSRCWMVKPLLRAPSSV